MKTRVIFRDSKGRFAKRSARRTLTMTVYRVKRTGKFQELGRNKGKFTEKKARAIAKKLSVKRQAEWVLRALKHVSRIWPDGEIKQSKVTSTFTLFKVTISNSETGTRVRLTVRRDKGKPKTKVTKREYATDGKFHVKEFGTHHPGKSGKAPYRAQRSRR